MDSWFERLSTYAEKSLLYEVVVNPKPGLVDPINSGPHKDMDAFTFIDSALVLAPYFRDIAEISTYYSDLDIKNLFTIIRTLGLSAEKKMFHVTNDVNTHKGAIFSLGIVVAATAYTDANIENFTIDDIFNTIQLMLKGLCNHDYNNLSLTMGNLTSGQIQYLEFGLLGIRGEAEAGFPVVRKWALPYLRKATGTRNQRFLDTLMVIVAHLDDSNLVKRAQTPDILKWSQEQAAHYLELGGCRSDKGMKFIEEMNQVFLEKNLSLGGSADLLIITIFFGLLEKIIPEN